MRVLANRTIIGAFAARQLVLRTRRPYPAWAPEAPKARALPLRYTPTDSSVDIACYSAVLASGPAPHRASQRETWLSPAFTAQIARAADIARAWRRTAVR